MQALFVYFLGLMQAQLTIDNFYGADGLRILFVSEASPRPKGQRRIRFCLVEQKYEISRSTKGILL